MPQIIYNFQFIFHLLTFVFEQIWSATNIWQLVRLLVKLSFVNHCDFPPKLVFIRLPASEIHEIKAHLFNELLVWSLGVHSRVFFVRRLLRLFKMNGTAQDRCPFGPVFLGRRLSVSLKLSWDRVLIECFWVMIKAIRVISILVKATSLYRVSIIWALKLFILGALSQSVIESNLKKSIVNLSLFFQLYFFYVKRYFQIRWLNR